MGYYKLIDAIDVPKNFSITERVNGYTKYRSIRLLPHKKYDIDELPNREVLEQLKKATDKIRYTPKYEEALKACGASYELKMCPTCGGKVKKIVYHVVEVVE